MKGRTSTLLHMIELVLVGIYTCWCLLRIFSVNSSVFPEPHRGHYIHGSKGRPHEYVSGERRPLLSSPETPTIQHSCSEINSPDWQVTVIFPCPINDGKHLGIEQRISDIYRAHDNVFMDRILAINQAGGQQRRYSVANSGRTSTTKPESRRQEARVGSG